MTGISFEVNYSSNIDLPSQNMDYSSIRTDGRYTFEYRKTEVTILYKETCLDLRVKSGLTEFIISILYSSNGEITVDYKNVLDAIQTTENVATPKPSNNNYIKYTPAEIEEEHSFIKKSNYLAAKLTTIFNYILLEPVDIKISIERDDGNLQSLLINYLMLGLCLTGHHCSDYIVSTQISYDNSFIIKDLLYSEEKQNPFLLSIWEMNSKRNLAVFTEGVMLKKYFKILYNKSEDECKQIFTEMGNILNKMTQNFKLK